MRRALVVGMCAAMLLALSAPSAWAQAKDPFEPLLTEDTGGGPVDDGADPTTTTTTTTTTTDPEPPPDEPLPSTGMDPSPWLGLAALALALGAGLLLLGRILDPPRTQI